MNRGKLLDLALAIFLCGMLALSLVVDFGPAGDLELGGRDLGPGCITRHLSGVECPFCGISHSLVALADGDLARSLDFHPLGPASAILFLAFIVAVTATIRRRTAPVIESRAFSMLCSSLLLTSLIMWGTRTVLG